MQQESRIAPAKLNLSLKVLGKRSDGFHEIESLMVPLSCADLGDHLQFEKTGEYSLHCDAVGVPTDESNLISKAVRAFEKATGKPCQWRVSLQKKIPHGAGLGGGSSDAATTLLALNELDAAGFSDQELAAMGSSFGSDVAFFIYQKACMVSGRGEIVEPVDMHEIIGQKVLLLKPGFGVSTPDAYRHCMDAIEIPGVDYSPQNMPWGEIVNELEKPVFYKHRFLAEMKLWLLAQAGVNAAMMSGSGSTMMAFLSDANFADELITCARRELDPGLWGCNVTIA
jgi:4-diphosphocytidyl-2-C-methyl-D-erythritol kinase